VTIQRVVELTFSGEDIHVIAVGDGEQAIARIEAEKPDIVLADIAMPKKNGYEVAAFVKDHPAMSHVPVLLLAGAFEPVDDERAKRVKSDGVLVKPFETHEVIARVRELLDSERRTQQPSSAVAEVPAAAVAPPPEEPAKPEESLDDYFDRLDLAFASRAQEPPRPFPHLSAPQSATAEASPRTSAAAPDTAAPDRRVIADLFQLFFEAEQGERDPASIRVPEAFERIRRHTIE